MGKEAHTPAPWATDPEVDHQAVLGPDNFMVADCAIFSFAKNGPTSARCTANARLIAAAPDMLSALREFQSVLAMLIDPANRTPSGAGIQNAYANCVAAEAKARAAISKATKPDGATL